MDPWQAAMRWGDFAAAWAVSDALLARHAAVLRDPALPPWVRRYWDGRPLDGLDVLVDCLHGLGDSLQFLRLLPLLRPRVRRLALRVQPLLLPLLDTAVLADAVLPLDSPVPPHDARVEVMELPHILRLQATAIPPPTPLRVAARPSASGGAAADVGVCWAGGDWDPARNLPAPLLDRLASVDGVRWWSLQLDRAAPRWAAACLASRDLLRQARAMQERLDLVISVDTMTAHLAATLGLPTWLLLPRHCDWRWMDQGDRSPWYPSMRLFRQPRAGEWSPVLDAVLEALRERRALNGGLQVPAPNALHDRPVTRDAVGGRAAP